MLHDRSRRITTSRDPPSIVATGTARRKYGRANAVTSRMMSSARSRKRGR
jgi:hypothetical protein